MQKELTEAARERLESYRQQALTQAEARQGRIYAACPGLYGIDREIAGTAMGIAGAALSDGGVAELARVREQLTTLQAQKTALLAAGGYTPEDLQPKYHCPICRDSGFAGGRRCSCWRELCREEAAKRLPPAALDGQCSFDSFDLAYYPQRDEAGGSPRQTMERILKLCRDYAGQMGAGAGSLLFLGKTGLGKTHLSLAIAGQAAERGCMVKYSSAQGIVDRYERTRFGRGPTAEDWDFVNAVNTADLLIIDDLGSEFNTAFSQSVLYNIINDRMMNSLSTIISTNLDTAKLTAGYEQRISSRILCGYTALGFVGKDIRLQKRMA